MIFQNISKNILADNMLFSGLGANLLLEFLLQIYSYQSKLGNFLLL